MFMDVFNVDFVFKYKFDKFDGEVDDILCLYVDEKFDLVIGVLKEIIEDFGGEVVEEKNIEQNEEEVF